MGVVLGPVVVVGVPVGVTEGVVDGVVVGLGQDSTGAVAADPSAVTSSSEPPASPRVACGVARSYLG